MKKTSLENLVTVSFSKLVALINPFLNHHLKLLMTVSYPMTNGHTVNVCIQVTSYGVVFQ